MEEAAAWWPSFLYEEGEWGVFCGLVGVSFATIAGVGPAMRNGEGRGSEWRVGPSLAGEAIPWEALMDGEETTTTMGEGEGGGQGWEAEAHPSDLGGSPPPLPFHVGFPVHFFFFFSSFSFFFCGPVVDVFLLRLLVSFFSFFSCEVTRGVPNRRTEGNNKEPHAGVRAEMAMEVVRGVEENAANEPDDMPVHHHPHGRGGGASFP